MQQGGPEAEVTIQHLETLLHPLSLYLALGLGMFWSCASSFILGWEGLMVWTSMSKGAAVWVLPLPSMHITGLLPVTYSSEETTMFQVILTILRFDVF